MVRPNVNFLILQLRTVVYITAKPGFGPQDKSDCDSRQIRL